MSASLPAETSGSSAHPQHYDTITDAQATPERAMPYAELGLKPDEYERILHILGRRPTNAELAMYSVMWSEHCSYKSTKKHLRQFGEKTTEQMRENLLVGMGQNAGVVDIGDDWAVTFKVESHNHPSFVEPYQGAATGVGGIVRDIIAMGARPVGVMDGLRFGAIDHPDTARVVHGVVAGVGGYGNCLGLPNIGGEVEFDASFQGNPLVNALCVGVLRRDDIHLANATGAGNAVVLFGARTGGDGIGGASILASETFEGGMPAKRPSVQVGDPFMEKVLIECCLELYAAGVVEAIQDLGAAGISCATSELAANGDGGMHVDLENVLLRDPSLTAGEILMSESQERMMAVVRPEKLEEFLSICAKWEVENAVIGEVTEGERLTIDHHGHRIVDVDPRTVAVDGPVYDRPFAEPAWFAEQQKNTADPLARPHQPQDLAEQILALAGSPNLAAKSWVTDQYDRFVQGHTALAQPDDAGVLRVDEETGLGVALATDANSRFTQLDPYAGAQQALAEAYRNVSTVGATPIAVSDCLNFGSPEHPDSMWQFVRAVEGLADACLAMGIPVTGGNVSLYNRTGDVTIQPVPLVAVLGRMADVTVTVPSGWTRADLRIFLLGATAQELDGSAWAGTIHGHLGGVPPTVDLAAEQRLGAVLRETVTAGEAHATHDLSAGGLAQALVEASLRFGVGASLDLSAVLERDGIDLATALFSETGARALIAVDDQGVDTLVSRCRDHGMILAEIGYTQSPDQIQIKGVADMALSVLNDTAAATLPRYFG